VNRYFNLIAETIFWMRANHRLTKWYLTTKWSHQGFLFVVRCTILLALLLVLGFVGLFALLFFVGYRRLAAAQGGRPHRFAAYKTSDCQHVPAHVYKRPDPMIYSQQYLISKGLAVTWDNPDIHIELGGVPVDSHDLKPNTIYDVIARIWNNSLDAVVVNMPVDFSFLSFGIGTKKTHIATTAVDVSAKGAPGCPAFARVQWTTPPTPGHFCLLVEFTWADDANPFNNVGQHNTDVKPLNSPNAMFTVLVRNPSSERHKIVLRLDAYKLPVLPDCGQLPVANNPRSSPDAVVRRLREIAAAANPARFPVPVGWTVTLDPAELSLEGGEQRNVVVDVTAPDGFIGRQTFNVTGFAGQTPISGVTLTVTG
jgi:hypothetical protein